LRPGKARHFLLWREKQCTHSCSTTIEKDNYFTVIEFLFLSVSNPFCVCFLPLAVFACWGPAPIRRTRTRWGPAYGGGPHPVGIRTRWGPAPGWGPHPVGTRTRSADPHPVGTRTRWGPAPIRRARTGLGPAPGRGPKHMAPPARPKSGPEDRHWRRHKGIRRDPARTSDK